MRTLFILMGLIIAIHPVCAEGQPAKFLTQYDYYTTEDSASILAYLPPSKSPGPYFISIDYMGDTLVSEFLEDGLHTYTIPIGDWSEGLHRMHVFLVDPDRDTLSNGLVLTKRAHKYNAVKINRRTGSLLVDGLPFYPFGFYCYSPVQPELPGEEVVRGFNMMSPYQKIEGKTLNERKKYMDRCARLGMKVHYNLLSVSGGGGVGSGRLNRLDDEERRQRLIDEIHTFKDHPALLAWYISDEPVGQKVPPEPLIEMYHLIKELDPYHPVSIVFMTPGRAREYELAMDIVMADPYPIPTGSVSVVGRVAEDLAREFYLEKPVWIVPQAFGGNEWWQREPTAAEIRVMTYLSLVEGAQGIQYFIRHGRNAFPKSVVAWNECSNMAHEVAELTPDLTQGYVMEGIRTGNRFVRVRGLEHDGHTTLLVVNTENRPRNLTLTHPAFKSHNSAEVVFENRHAPVRNGSLQDQIDALGTRIYRLYRLENQGPDHPYHEHNMVLNPGFEQLVSPLIPTGTYARLGADRGSTYFVDSRVAKEGSHAVRLVTPLDYSGTGLSFFPVALRNGYSYTIEIWARGKTPDPDWKPFEPSWFKRLINWLFGWLKKPEGPAVLEFELSLGSLGSEIFELTDTWKKYAYSVYVDGLSSGMQRVNPRIELIREGTAWFDLIQVVPDMDLETTAGDEWVEVRLENLHHTGVLKYTLDSTNPGVQSAEYTRPIILERSAYITAAVFEGDSSIGRIFKEVVVHDGMSARIALAHGPSPRYAGRGPRTLQDGSLGSLFFRDDAWLGFEEKDLTATLTWSDAIRLDDLEFSFLEDPGVDIFLPGDLSIEISEDGRDYHTAYEITGIEEGSREGTPRKKHFYIQLDSQPAMSVRITAKNRGEWLFMDEIIVNKK